MDERVASDLGTNIRKLREGRGLSQGQIAKMAGMPRATWANLESGAANPTLSVLIKAASALQVRIEEIIAPPKASAKLHRASTLPVRRRGRVSIRKLLPEPLPGLEIERIDFPPSAQFSGIPHTPGTREYLTCELGEVELTVSGSTFRLAAGDVVVFRGDQKHGYRNPGTRDAVAYSIVAFSPVERD